MTLLVARGLEMTKPQSITFLYHVRVDYNDRLFGLLFKCGEWKNLEDSDNSSIITFAGQGKGETD